jgi:hypothetical protein
MKRAPAIVALLIVGVLLVYGIIALFNPHTMPLPLPMPKPLVWGAYSGEAADFLAFEQKMGKTAGIAATFVGFDEEFPQDFVSGVGSPTTTPLLFLEIPDDSNLKEVIDGRFDANLRDFAAQAKDFGNEIILVPFNEPNLNESSWGFGTSPNNTAANFKAAWVHVHDLFAEAPNVKFGLAYNNVSIPEDPQNTFESLYPGSQYVDYVGIDGFNWQEDGQWETFAEVLGSSTQELMQFDKPIYLFSIGTGEDTGGNPNLKAAWIADMYGWLKDHPEVAGFVWFNEDKSQAGEKNWLVDSNPEAFTAFKAGLAQ